MQAELFENAQGWWSRFLSSKAWYNGVVVLLPRSCCKKVLAQVDSWIEQCPYPYGINWSSSLECAIRVINWTFAYSFLTAADPDLMRTHDRTVRRWIFSVHEHLAFIAQHLSRYSSANNHRIGEVSGLFIGALAFRFDSSARWMALAKKVLEEEAVRQHWADGVNKEQAISYQSFVFDFLLLPALLGRRNGIEFSAPYWEGLERSAEFVCALMDAGGEVPKIGDEDEGAVVRLSWVRPATPYRSMVTCAASLFGRADLRAKTRAFDEHSFWLLGVEGERRYDEAVRVGTDRVAFPDGGYHVLGAGDAWLLFDCGPLGYLSLAAHGHADALSIMLRYRGKDFIVDPGTYAYHTKRAFRDYFRGTGAHSTVRVDGLDQSVGGGSFMWLSKARTTLLERTRTTVRGRHDGYLRLKHPLVHERQVTFEEGKDRYLIVDVITSDGPHRIEQLFHFAPECTVVEDGGRIRVEREGTEIEILPDAKVTERSIVRGSERPILGWYSPRFDVRVPTTTLVLRSSVAEPAVLSTAVNLVRPGRE